MPSAPAAPSIDYARRALAGRRRRTPPSWSHAAMVLAYFGEDIGTMIGLVDRAVMLNPSFARGWCI